MGFEGPSAGKQAKSETSYDRLEQAYQSSKSYLGSRDVKLTEYDVRPYYDESRVQAFLTLPKQSDDPDPGKKYSVFQEALTYHGIRDAKWMGDEYGVAKRSEYDDYNKQLDLVAVVRGETSPGEHGIKAMLGVDLTTGKEDYEEKMGDIVYDLHNNPETLFCQFFADYGSGVGGKQDIPEVVMHYNQEELDKFMPAWKDPKANRETIANSHLPSRILTQALFQSAVFKSMPSKNQGANAAWRMKYARNEVHLRNALMKKIQERKKMPYRAAHEVVDVISGVTNWSPQVVRSLVCKEGDRTKPYLHQLVWGR